MEVEKTRLKWAARGLVAASVLHTGIANGAVYPRETDKTSARHSELSENPSAEILRIDLDQDGDPDILERWWNGKRVRWFDENDDATQSDVWGDMVHDALQVDKDGDGFYDGPNDYNVKWADTDGDGIPDVQVFNSNPQADSPTVFANAAVYFVSMDPDNTGLLLDIDWNDLSPSWTRYQKGPNWNCNYHGNATFLKEHAPIWAIDTPEFSWENPFLFFDPDGDGLSEVSLRVADNRQPTSALNNTLRFDGIVDEAWVSYDLDNDTGRDNEMDYDLTLYVGHGTGLDYKDQVHEYPQLRAPDWAAPFYRHFEWRQQTRFIYLNRDGAISRLFGAPWAKAYLTVDEDDDSHRWERVELYYPGDPYLLKRADHKSPIWHNQSDSLGDRGEWDMDFSGKAKLYRAAWDGKIHLLGAERGAWTVDRKREYWGAAHNNGGSSSKMATKVQEVIQYRDTDGNGYIDTISYDYDGDRTPERTDSLLQLGVDDKGTLLDVTLMDWNALRAENTKSVKRSWADAQRLYRLAFRQGYVDQEIHRLSKASSIGEKTDKAYWLQEHIIRKLLAELPENLHAGILRNYYKHDLKEMGRILATVPRPMSKETAAPSVLQARFVPERSDDFAWENDLIAFRAYGPALRNGTENAGIDCWLKRVDYPIIDKWYDQSLNHGKSYHVDHGEGQDNYHVGSSAGCGGTALWINGKREPLETFVGWEIVEQTVEKSVFALTYEATLAGKLYKERKQITIVPGQRLFRVDSTFWKDGQRATKLPIAIGVTTHDGKATPSSNTKEGWIACWETLDGFGLGTGVVMDPSEITEIRLIKPTDPDTGHIVIIAETDYSGRLGYHAGYGWEKAGSVTTEAQWQNDLKTF